MNRFFIENLKEMYAIQPRIKSNRSAISESTQLRALTLILLFVLTIMVATTVGYLVGKSAGLEARSVQSPDLIDS